MRNEIEKYLRKPYVIPAAVGLVSAAAGFAAGYILGNRVKTDELMAAVDSINAEQLVLGEDWTEDDVVTTQYPPADRPIEFSDSGPVVGRVTKLANDPSGIVADIMVDEPYVEEVRKLIDPPEALREPESLDNEPQTHIVQHESKDTPVADFVREVLEQNNHPVSDLVQRQSIWGDSEPDEWNYEREFNIRTGDAPYVLHADEFHAKESAYQQMALHYYESDDVLTDEHDVPIPDYNVLTGSLQFGHGSNDPNVVYIRNEEARSEYQIMRIRGSYGVEILGYEPDPKRVER